MLSNRVNKTLELPDLTLWGYTINSTLDWTVFIVLLIVAILCLFLVIWFVERYTTGMVGGFMLIAGGMGLVLQPSYYLIANDANTPMAIVCAAAIVCGCIAVLTGSYSLRNYQDF